MCGSIDSSVYTVSSVQSVQALCFLSGFGSCYNCAALLCAHLPFLLVFGVTDVGVPVKISLNADLFY